MAMTKHHPYALGVWDFLVWARRYHQRQNHGAAPKLFVISRESFRDLAEDDRAKGYASWLHYEPSKRRYLFMGVELRQDEHASEPFMITCRGEPELL